MRLEKGLDINTDTSIAGFSFCIPMELNTKLREILRRYYNNEITEIEH
jgi:hypothetical protein